MEWECGRVVEECRTGCPLTASAIVLEKSAMTAVKVSALTGMLLADAATAGTVGGTGVATLAYEL